MNKTVNINLAGIFFHIDEDAYLKLQRYLEAIKRSFTDSQGRAEIIADIEARIAELFNERVQNDKQVIRIKEVDEVISIMGQPEDYLVDDEIFEDEPQATYKRRSQASKKLFRDTDNSYIGGVSSGLAHYFGIDAIWIRLAWVLLIFGAGTGVLLYILLWILVPEANTTAEKLMMTGEPVNISNIEKKIKDGFDSVTETVSDVAKNVSDSVSNAAKKVDVKKGANSIKSSSRSFFDTLADVIMFFLKVFAKLVGVFLIFVGASALIALIIGLFLMGIIDTAHLPGVDIADFFATSGVPIGLGSIIVFFAIGIPFFFLFYLGLKILINNLKSIGSVAKFSLLGLWIISIISLIFIGVRQASEHTFEETFIEKTELPITTSDTLNVKMIGHDNFNPHSHRYSDNFKLAHDENGDKVLFSSDINLLVKSTTDSVATIAIEKTADGRDYETAIKRAKSINYGFELNNNTLTFNSYLTTNPKNKFREQKVDVILYLPENTLVYFNNSTKAFIHHRRYNGNLVLREHTNHYVKILDEDSECLDCPEEDTVEINIKTPKVKINDEGIEINSDETHVKIDKNGIKAESEEVKLNINSDGVNLESE
ncbi:PspC domain-containing protein [Tamlana crocina]